LQNTPTFNVELPGLTFSSFEHSGPTPAKFNLAVFMHESPAELQGTVVFRRDLFDESTIATWMQRFEVLLQSIVRQIDTPVNALEMHTVAEHAKTTKKKFEQKRGIRSARREQFNIPDSDTRQGK
jgi:non-ribosomal peptide synthetase component F